MTGQELYAKALVLGAFPSALHWDELPLHVRLAWDELAGLAASDFVCSECGDELEEQDATSE